MDVIIYCSENPGAALDSELAIDYESQKLQIDSILDDFRLLADRLRLTYVTTRHSHGPNKVFRPWSSRDNGQPAKNFPKAVTSMSIPTDPWGRDYDYVCEPFAGVAIPYKLQSLGADGVEGWHGENADIKHTYLPYFDHINQL